MSKPDAELLEVRLESGLKVTVLARPFANHPSWLAVHATCEEEDGFREPYGRFSDCLAAVGVDVPPPWHFYARLAPENVPMLKEMIRSGRFELTAMGVPLVYGDLDRKVGRIDPLMRLVEEALPEDVRQAVAGMMSWPLAQTAHEAQANALLGRMRA